MHILYVLENFYPLIGGSEKLFFELAKGLRERGHRITVITRKQKGLSAYENVGGIEIKRIRSKSRTTFGITAVSAITDISGKADLVHSTLYSGAVGAALARKITGKKTILTVHELYRDLWHQLPYLSRSEKLAYKNLERTALKLGYDAFIAVSDYTLGQLREALGSGADIRRIYNGLPAIENIKRKSDAGHTNFRFVYYGRPGVGKGIDLLVGAIRQLIEEETQTSWEFHFIVPLQDQKTTRDILTLERENAQKGEIFIHEPMDEDDLFEFLSGCDCAVIPSISEGFCFVAVECAQLDLPVIHSGRGALPETVSGRNIRMREYSINGLMQAMRSAMDNEYDSVPIKRFPLETMIDSYEDLYEKMLS